LEKLLEYIRSGRLDNFINVYMNALALDRYHSPTQKLDFERVEPFVDIILKIASSGGFLKVVHCLKDFYVLDYKDVHAKLNEAEFLLNLVQSLE
jgi:hypothetical protein